MPCASISILTSSGRRGELILQIKEKKIGALESAMSVNSEIDTTIYRDSLVNYNAMIVGERLSIFPPTDRTNEGMLYSLDINAKEKKVFLEIRNVRSDEASKILIGFVTRCSFEPNTNSSGTVIFYEEENRSITGDFSKGESSIVSMETSTEQSSIRDFSDFDDIIVQTSCKSNCRNDGEEINLQRSNDYSDYTDTNEICFHPKRESPLFPPPPPSNNNNNNTSACTRVNDTSNEIKIANNRENLEKVPKDRKQKTSEIISSSFSAKTTAAVLQKPVTLPKKKHRKEEIPRSSISDEGGIVVKTMEFYEKKRRELEEKRDRLLAETLARTENKNRRI